MVSRKCFCKYNISKIVRPALTALTVDGLKCLVIYTCTEFVIKGETLAKCFVKTISFACKKRGFIHYAFLLSQRNELTLL